MTMTTMKIENRNDDVVDEEEEQGQSLFVQDWHTSCLSLPEPLPQIEMPSRSDHLIIPNCPTHHSFPVLIQTRCASLSFVNS